MEHPLIAALEHPLIVALRHAGLTTQHVARQLLHAHTVPGSEPEFAALVEALTFDQLCAGGRNDRQALVTRGLQYRVKRRAARAQRLDRTDIMDALVSIPRVDRRRIIVALAAGTGAELATQLQADRNRLITGIETELATGTTDQAAMMRFPEPLT
jgi:hypothetical protein